MPDDKMNDLPGIGHNKGPLYDQATLDEFLLRANSLDDKAKAFGKAGIQSDDDAEQVNDLIKGMGLLIKEVNKARLDAKRPYDEASAAIQSAFKPILEPLAKVKEQADKLLKAYHRRRAEEERQKAEAERQKAEAERRAAEAAAKMAEADGDAFAAAQMEAKAKEAADAEKRAAKGGGFKIGSASGAGISYAYRKETIVTITNAVILATYYVRAGHTGVMEALQKAAEADVRAKDVDHSQIPGINVETK